MVVKMGVVFSGYAGVAPAKLCAERLGAHRIRYRIIRQKRTDSSGAMYRVNREVAVA